MRALALSLCLIAAAWPLAAAAGPYVALDNILLSKVNGVTKLEIWPGCTMRYVDHSPRDAGLELRIRVAVDADCDINLENVQSESYSPSSLRLGNVDEVSFDRRNIRDTFITLHFSEPQKFEVRQHQVGWIEIFVDTTVASASLPPAKPAPIDEVPNREEAATTAANDKPRPPATARLPSAKKPSGRVNVPPEPREDFVVQLGIFSDPVPALAVLERTSSPHFAYTSEFELNGSDWHGVSVGFFDSEAAAQLVLDQYAAQFPDAWIRIVTESERVAARAAGEARVHAGGNSQAVRVIRDTNPGQGELNDAMIDGRRALLEQRYADAISEYTFVLESPGHEHGAEAREMLGVAHERTGNIQSAIGEYSAFLAEYPDHLTAERVRDRVTSLTLAAEDSTATTAVASARRAAPESDAWRFHGGISHYYWRNQEQVVHDGDYLVSGSGLLGLADFSASRRGSRFDLLARFNGAYQHDLAEDRNTGDIAWVSDAFVDIRDKQWDWQARLGRQTRRADGVPTRFDGVGVRYALKPDLSVSVSAGVPMDSPRYIGDADRAFIAGSARMTGLLDGRATASVFTHQQTVDGIYDRQAVGGDITYRQGNVTVLSYLDIDLSYNTLNTVLVNTVWRLENGWTVNGRVDVGSLPYLTTRNALSGQQATSVAELLEVYSEGQVRRLARDRTAQATTASAGLSIPLGERFDLSLDATLRRSDGTVASGGVAAIPATGDQLFLNAMLVGTSVIRENDLLMMTLRSNTTRSRDTTSLLLDARLPFGRALRINPRLTVSQHTPNDSRASKQTILTPAMRVLYRWRSVLFELEAGGRWSNRELPLSERDPFTTDGTEELLGGFVNIGYRLEF